MASQRAKRERRFSCGRTFSQQHTGLRSSHRPGGVFTGFPGALIQSGGGEINTFAGTLVVAHLLAAGLVFFTRSSIISEQFLQMLDPKCASEQKIWSSCTKRKCSTTENKRCMGGWGVQLCHVRKSPIQHITAIHKENKSFSHCTASTGMALIFEVDHPAGLPPSAPKV